MPVPLQPTAAPPWEMLAALDDVRRAQGALLDAVGLGPLERPHATVFEAPGVALRRYGTGREPGARLLLVPAPIKRPYIWDLAPGASVVEACLAARARVFLVDWRPAPAGFGLADYADRLIGACLDAAGEGETVLVAHSLGGLFAATYAALHPERVRALVLLAAPLHFGGGAGIFDAMVAALDLGTLPPSIPGSFLSLASFQASPATFGLERGLDFAASLARPDALASHLRVERWTLDEFALPRRLVADLATLAREDRLVRGELAVGARIAAPRNVTAPLLCVVDPRCRVVPPEAVLPFVAAAASADKRVLHYGGDVGVSLQHVGMLVGASAHARLWPEILRWIAAHAGGGRPRRRGAAREPGGRDAA
ncbi:MAG: alpha/beta fold hydrolase [Burkholderiales bacterium]|nr:alpha/beta fold hydrolase [Burkholderiales bacterium]